ncbi:endosomal transmembrane epsin interactor 1 [Boleophthalmus pectinirostris]|uniref:endosomal transmembrane epsin interactor 1 n=1 Tax=Boleophthalmus pectinirostris TaxID=150288 RepID=UPI000A1C2A91|nr:endosomal transmembrane epsin interactor 1 [Boleophthalmus pectinirostris]
MSLPVVLPGSCCPAVGSSHVESSHRQRPRSLWCSRADGAASSRPLPGRPLLSLGLLQLLLGGSMVALSYGALSLSSSAPVRNSCPFWAGSSVILSGIVGLLTWRRPMLLMVNMFVLLSVVCVLLSLAGFVLCCQGAQMVSNMSSCQQVGDMCYCCLLARTSKCPEDKLLELQPAHSCTTMKILLKKMMFALCALNALTTAVCLMAAALRYLRLFSTRTSCLDEPRHPAEGEVPTLEPDPDEFVPPAPPPSYFSTFYSYTPQLARRVLRDGVIPLPHIYGARIKGVEVFCPLDPPPPYEEVAGGGASAQEPDSRSPGATSSADLSSEEPRGMGPLELPSAGPLDRAPEPSPSLACVRRKARLSRSSSDPVLTEDPCKGWSSEPPTVPHTVDSSTQTSQPILPTKVTLRRGCGTRAAPRPRPSSMVDYQSYRYTQLLVQRILEQPAQGLAPELQELVDSIRTVLRSDQEHMEEAVRCAGFMDQVLVDSERRSSVQPVPSTSQTFPRPPSRRTALLHLQSCGDLSSVACPSLDSLKRGAKKTGASRPERHSLATVSRETAL